MEGESSAPSGPSGPSTHGCSGDRGVQCPQNARGEVELSWSCLGFQSCACLPRGSWQQLGGDFAVPCAECGSARDALCSSSAVPAALRQRLLCDWIFLLRPLSNLNFYFAHFLDFCIGVAGELLWIHSQLGKEIPDSKIRENKPSKETSIPVTYPQFPGIVCNFPASLAELFSFGEMEFKCQIKPRNTWLRGRNTRWGSQEKWEEVFVGKKVRKEMAGEGLWWQSVSSPVLSWELSQKSREDKNHHMALECFDAAKRKFRPKEMFLKMNSEVYWELMSETFTSSLTAM